MKKMFIIGAFMLVGCGAEDTSPGSGSCSIERLSPAIYEVVFDKPFEYGCTKDLENDIGLSVCAYDVGRPRSFFVDPFGSTQSPSNETFNTECTDFDENGACTANPEVADIVVSTTLAPPFTVSVTTMVVETKIASEDSVCEEEWQLTSNNAGSWFCRKWKEHTLCEASFKYEEAK